MSDTETRSQSRKVLSSITLKLPNGRESKLSNGKESKNEPKGYVNAIDFMIKEIHEQKLTVSETQALAFLGNLEDQEMKKRLLDQVKTYTISAVADLELVRRSQGVMLSTRNFAPARVVNIDPDLSIYYYNQNNNDYLESLIAVLSELFGLTTQIEYSSDDISPKTPENSKHLFVEKRDELVSTPESMNLQLPERDPRDSDVTSWNDVVIHVVKSLIELNPDYFSDDDHKRRLNLKKSGRGKKYPLIFAAGNVSDEELSRMRNTVRFEVPVESGSKKITAGFVRSSTQKEALNLIVEIVNYCKDCLNQGMFTLKVTCDNAVYKITQNSQDGNWTCQWDWDPRRRDPEDLTNWEEFQLENNGISATKSEDNAVNCEKTNAFEEITVENLITAIKNEKLYFPNKEILCTRIHSAIKEKHLILVGPPGTGKSKLAKAICRCYHVPGYLGDPESHPEQDISVDEADYFIMRTASSDWSTYETIGSYVLKENVDGNGTELVFKQGMFLDCFKCNDQADSDAGGSKNVWLIIDEINRADIDKAFGVMFSVLAGDSVVLPFQLQSKVGSKDIVLQYGEPDDKNDIDLDATYCMPEDWRIIGTMNVFDKNTLYDLSYAFMRRFAFIYVDVPDPNNDADAITEFTEYLKCWFDEEDPNPELKDWTVHLWKAVSSVRKIGPAIIYDIYSYLRDTGRTEGTWSSESADLSGAIMLYIVPQLEGLDEERLRRFLEAIKDDKILSSAHKEVKSYLNDLRLVIDD